MASRLVELVGYQQTKNHQREKTEEWGERAAQNEERRGWGNISGEHPGECRTAPVVTSWEETQCCWHVLQGSPRLQSWAAPCVASHWCWSICWWLRCLVSTWWSFPSLLQRERGERETERKHKDECSVLRAGVNAALDSAPLKDSLSWLCLLLLFQPTSL